MFRPANNLNNTVPVAKNHLKFFFIIYNNASLNLPGNEKNPLSLCHFPTRSVSVIHTQYCGAAQNRFLINQNSKFGTRPVLSTKKIKWQTRSLCSTFK